MAAGVINTSQRMQSNKVLLKQMTIQFLGNSQNYEHFKRMVEASPHLYAHDFTYYNDDIATRHHRNLKELAKIQALIEQQTIVPAMLAHNTSNSFYPSYVLHHHHSIFQPLLLSHFANQVPGNKQQASRWVGAFLQKTKSINVKPSKELQLIVSDKGEIEMGQDFFYYSPHSSPYLTHALLVARQGEKQMLVLVAVREKGSLCRNISVFDFGGTISNDYLPIGYNFNQVKPIAVLQLSSGPIKTLGKMVNRQLMDQFTLSLKDLQRSLWITVHYTSMRTQFKNIPDSKQERPIGSYQAVSARIIEHFALYTAFSDLNSRLLQNQDLLVRHYTDLLPGSHHIILESLIALRQCCGGFGYLQVSGHPASMERVCNRAGDELTSVLPFSKQFLKATQFYASSEELLKFYAQEIKQPKIAYLQYFGLFLSICENMRRLNQKECPREYKREYLKQSAIMVMHAREEFLRYEASNVHCQLHQYLIYSYIAKNASFINWQLTKLSRQAFIAQLNHEITTLYHSLARHIPTLAQALELGFLRNVVIGRPNQENFYAELVKASKENLRNHPQFSRYIREPIAEMLTKNSASL